MPFGWWHGDTTPPDAPSVPGWWAEFSVLAAATAAALTVTGGSPGVSTGFSVTPTGRGLTVTGGVPAVVLTDHKFLSPVGAVVSVIGSHPAIGLTLRPGGATPAVTGGVPGVVLSDNKILTPTGASLTVTGGTPLVGLTDHKFILPTGAPLTVGGGVPGIVTPNTLTPGGAGVAVAGSAPVVTVGITTSPGGASLAVLGGTPVVLTPIVVAPTGAVLAVTGSHPALGLTLRPTDAALAASGGTPTVALSDNRTYTPSAAPLAVTAGTPVVTATDLKTATPTGAALTISGATPAVVVTNHKLAIPTAAPLAATGATPIITVALAGPPWIDDFNRSNGALGANWDDWDNTLAAAVISSNKLVPDPVDLSGQGRYLKTATGSNIGVSVVVKGSMSDASDALQLITGANNTADTACGSVAVGPGGVYLIVAASGAGGASGSLTVADGDVIAVEKYSANSGTTSTITLFKNGSKVDSYTDAYSYSGNPETAAVILGRGSSSPFAGVDDFTVYNSTQPPDPKLIQPAGATLTTTGGAPKVRLSTSFIGGNSSESTTVTVPAHNVGDLIVIIAFRDGNTTAPSLGSGYTNIIAPSGANSCSIRAGYKVATATNDTSQTWSNATGMVSLVYRNAGTPTNATSSNGSSATVSFASQTITDTTGQSWVVGVCGHRSVNGNLNVTGSLGAMNTNRVNLAGSTNDMAAFDTNAGVTSYTGGTIASGETSSGFFSIQFELPNTTA